ncbi:MAG: ATP-dependent RNA helicase HrpA [Actinomycetia bacterium]|nr:ATP-dependent RNA helicase HrpA [Actinomycetes bacterium]
MTDQSASSCAPVLQISPDLPIAEAAPEIAAALLSSQVVIVAGETGSGKTTQLPKLCLMAGRRRIGHTQPRRIAARTLAERIAAETRTEVGDLVGYQVRFTKQAGRQTRVKVMTDGILLSEISQDRLLRRYDTVIIDEAHERSLNIDFLLGYLKQLLPKRPDLKVIVTSATIDTERFSAHFDHAPIVRVEGRTYPVEVRYRPVRDDGAVSSDSDEQPRPVPEAVAKDLNEAICDAVRELCAAGDGDILVFLSGEREIRDAAEAIEALQLRFTEVLPLYARLSAAEQHRVFTAHQGRRVVLATNVAETSLTVPGIRYVVDPGTARISRYSKRTKVQRLPIEPVSQASANQRAGRCGRVAPGICIRLYSEADYLARPEFTEPEILRTNLASVILQMAEAGLGDIAAFPFVEPPDTAQITDGLRLLTELGALRPGRATAPRLTPVGKQMARLPVDPRLARILVEAARLGCLREALVVVSALAIPDVRERPVDKRQQADERHRRFHAPITPTGPGEPDGSDFVALLRLWQYLKQQRTTLSGNAFRRLCRDDFLSFLRIREWQDLHQQLRQLCTELGLERNREPAPADLLHTAVVSGLLSHVGLLDMRTERKDLPPRKRARLGPREYLGSRGSRWAISPGSALAKTPPPLAVAFELVETTRLWARTVAAISPEWVEAVGGHLLKRTYAEPRWVEATGTVVADETVSLYGVPIISSRTVSYAQVDPVEARRLFIQAALVEGRWRTRHHFVRRNQAVRDQVAELEERTRRRDLVVDDQAIYDFYDARVPAEVVSQQHFDTWWRRKRREQDDYLDLRLEDLVAAGAESVDADGFPDWWRVGDHELEVSYVFDPGSQHDGVSVEIPLGILNQLPPAAFTWQVPGLRAELATELIRSLPKRLRTAFVPAPNHAAAALAWLEQRPDVASAAQGDTAPDTISFSEALAVALRSLTGTEPAGAWQEQTLPAHLQLSLVVTDGEREVAYGSDLAELQRRLAPELTRTLTRASRTVAVTGATGWSFSELETRHTTRRSSGAELAGYPAVQDEGSSVGVVVLDTEARARAVHARGVRRLLALTTPDPTTWVVSRMSNQTRLQLGASPYPSVAALLADCRLKALDRCLAELGTDPWTVRSPDRFAEVSVPVREQMADTMRAVVAYTGDVLGRYQAVQRLLPTVKGPTADDVTEQVANLVFAGFVVATEDPWFGRLERYLHAAEMRLTAYASNPARQRQPAEVVAELEDEYAEVVARQPQGPLSPEVVRVGWLLEELRVSLFAQQLRTSEPVSAKRVRAALACLG